MINQMRNPMKTLTTLFLSLCLLSSSAFAEIDILGFTTGKTTLTEIREKYTFKDPDEPITKLGYPKNGVINRLSGKQLNQPELYYATLFFDDKQKLGKLLLSYPSNKNTFHSLLNAFKERYPEQIKILFQSPFFDDKDSSGTIYMNTNNSAQIIYISENPMATITTDKMLIKIEQTPHGTYLTSISADYYNAIEQARNPFRTTSAQ